VCGANVLNWNRCENPPQPKKERLWRLVSKDSRVNTTCECSDHPGDKKKREQKMVIYNVAVANNPAVRAIVSKGVIIKIQPLISKLRNFLKGLSIPTKEYKKKSTNHPCNKSQLSSVVPSLLPDSQSRRIWLHCELTKMNNFIDCLCWLPSVAPSTVMIH